MSHNPIDFLLKFKKAPLKNKEIISVKKREVEDFDQFLVNWTSHTRTKISASLITNILSGAEEGCPQEQAALFQTIMEKEPVIAAHIQTRILSVLASDWNIVPAKAQDTESSEKANELYGILKNAGMYMLMKHLLDALPTGYAGSAIIWGEGGVTVESFKHIHPANWMFDMGGNPALTGVDGREKSLAEYHPNQFIFHTHQLKPGIPACGGILRTLVWLYFFKHYALRDRARYLERFGIPFVMAKISRDDFENDSIKSQILNSLHKMGSDGVGLVTSDSHVDVINTSASNGGSDFHEWFNYIDNIYALVILGQVATSKEASGMSKGQIQENVRKDILEADCRCLAETLNRHLIAPLESFRYGSQACELVLNYEKTEYLMQRAEIVKILTEAGFVIDSQYIQKTFGIPLLKKTEQ